MCVVMRSAMSKPAASSAAELIALREERRAIAFYTQKLFFYLVEDTHLGAGKRWVQVSPPNGNGTNLLLAQAVSPEQKQAVENQAGGRVFLFLQTNDFWRDYQQMKAKGVHFNEEPREEATGLLSCSKTSTATNGI